MPKLETFVVFLLVLTKQFSVETVAFKRFSSGSSFSAIQPSSVGCGGTERPLTGSISYKAFDTLLPNERCVWTVRVENATGYVVTILNKGFPNQTSNPNGITISGFGMNRLVTQETGVQLGIDYVFEKCAFLVVTFHTTSPGRFTGFTLAYSGLYGVSGESIVSPMSSDTLAMKTLGYTKHPPGGMSYSGNDLSSFIFTPVNNIFNARKITQVFFNSYSDSQLGYYGVLHVYYYKVVNPTVGLSWAYMGTIPVSTSIEVFSNADPLLLIYEAEGSGQGISIPVSGFQLTHSYICAQATC